MSWQQKLNEDGMLRVDYFIPLAASVPDTTLVELIESLDEKSLREILDLPKGKKKDLYLEELIEDAYAKDIAEALIEMHPYKIIAHVSTPVMRDKSFSWGLTYNKVFIGPSIEDIVDQAFTWKDGLNKKKVKK